MAANNSWLESALDFFLPFGRARNKPRASVTLNASLLEMSFDLPSLSAVLHRIGNKDIGRHTLWETSSPTNTTTSNAGVAPGALVAPGFLADAPAQVNGMDLVWPGRVLTEMKSRGTKLSQHYQHL